MWRRALHLALAYVTAGALMVTVFYFLSGGDSPFASDVHRVVRIGAGAFEVAEASPRVREIPELVAVYVLRRWPLGVLEGLLLAWLVRRSTRPFPPLLLGALVPVLFELAVATPYEKRWIGALVAALAPGCAWARPAYPPEYFVHAAVGEFLPGVVAGLIVAAWALRIARRAHAEDG